MGKKTYMWAVWEFKGPRTDTAVLLAGFDTMRRAMKHAKVAKRLSPTKDVVVGRMEKVM